MNKKLNAAIFMVLALVFNVIVSGSLLIGGLLLARPILGPNPDQFASMIVYMLLTALVIGGTFLLYNAALGALLKKTKLESLLPDSFRKKK